MKKNLFALLTVLVMLAGIIPFTATAAMDPSEYGKWIGGSDPDCKHPAEKQTLFGDMPGDPSTPAGYHLRVINCECGAQIVEQTACSDNDGDGFCDNCGAAMATATIGDLSDATVTLSSVFGNNTWYYTGEAIEPGVSVWMGETYLYEGDDYSVTYSNNTEVGTGVVTVTALAGGCVTGETTATFTIKQLNGDLGDNSNMVLLFDDDWNETNLFPWTGSSIEPHVMVELDGNVTLTGNEYTVTYSNNTHVGKASVTITGNGEETMGVPITGQRTVYFKISKGDCKHDGKKKYTYQYGEKEHTIICEICGEEIGKEAHSYSTHKETYRLIDLIHTNGTADFCVCGDSINFTPGFSGIEIQGIPDQTYTGKPIEPPVEVKADVKDENGATATITVPKEYYNIGYKDNIGPGTGLVLIDIMDQQFRKEFLIEDKSAGCAHTNTTRKYDEQNHWDECDVCHTRLNLQPHNPGNRNCDDLSHWIDCTGCEARLKEEAHKDYQYVSEGPEKHRIVCGFCGKWLAHPQHSFIKKQEGNDEWEECEKCGEKRNVSEAGNGGSGSLSGSPSSGPEMLAASQYGLVSGLTKEEQDAFDAWKQEVEQMLAEKSRENREIKDRGWDNWSSGNAKIRDLGLEEWNKKAREEGLSFDSVAAFKNWVESQQNEKQKDDSRITLIIVKESVDGNGSQDYQAVRNDQTKRFYHIVAYDTVEEKVSGEDALSKLLEELENIIGPEKTQELMQSMNDFLAGADVSNLSGEDVDNFLLKILPEDSAENVEKMIREFLGGNEAG